MYLLTPIKPHYKIVVIITLKLHELHNTVKTKLIIYYPKIGLNKKIDERFSFSKKFDSRVSQKRNRSYILLRKLKSCRTKS